MQTKKWTKKIAKNEIKYKIPNNLLKAENFAGPEHYVFVLKRVT